MKLHELTFLCYHKALFVVSKDEALTEYAW